MRSFGPCFGGADAGLSPAEGLGRGFGGHGRVHLEGEDRAFAGPALHPDLASEPLGDVGADGEAEPPAAAVLAEVRFDLDEGAEELGLLFGRHAGAGVLDLEAQPRPAVLAGAFRDAQRDRAFGGELDRVAEEVVEHLLEPDRIGSDPPRQAAVERDDEAQALLPRARMPPVRDLVEKVEEVEVARFDAHLALLDLGEVEQVGEQVHQRPARRDDGLHMALALVVEGRQAEELGEAHDRVEGRADLVAHGRGSGTSRLASSASRAVSASLRRASTVSRLSKKTEKARRKLPSRSSIRVAEWTTGRISPDFVTISSSAPWLRPVSRREGVTQSSTTRREASVSRSRQSRPESSA
jgi:hypothetical protein